MTTSAPCAVRRAQRVVDSARCAVRRARCVVDSARCAVRACAESRLGAAFEGPQRDGAHACTAVAACAMRGASVVAALLALVVTCSACAGPRDTRTPRHGQPARRVISLVPAVTEMLFAIGAGAQVIAVSSFDHYPPEVNALPRVGALLDPDVERILSMRPDLVAVFEGQDELQQKLEQAHIEVLSYRRGRAGRSQLAEIPAQAIDLGRLTGHEREARQMADRLMTQLTDVLNRPPRLDPGAGGHVDKVMLVIGREPGTLRNIYVSGGVGFLADMLAALHERNAFGEVRRENLQVTTEAILAAQPDVIIEVVASRPWSAEDIAREERVWNPLSSLPAVRSHRVHVLVGDEFVIPGPRVVDALRRLGAAIAAP